MSVRFRQRKISVKQSLHIYNQKDLNANELELSQINHLDNRIGKEDVNSVDTGVDKNEQSEVHLQQVINAAQKALLSTNKTDQLYIPTPDASRIWPEASQYYNQIFNEPKSYICYSYQSTYDQYNIDEEDEEFVKKLDLSEYEFEVVMDNFEKIIEKKQPFLSLDPSNILSYDEIKSHINPSLNLKERLGKEINYTPFKTIFDTDLEARPINKLLDLFGKKIYEHWKKRKLDRHGKSIQPSLKFEDPNANEKDNDNDPYVCFRRREFRQVRKTRRSDTLGAERIRLLQKSLQKARELILDVSEREILKLQTFQAEHELFKLRCEGKALKRSLNIKNDDHLYIAQKRKRIIKEEKKVEKKRKPEEKPSQQPQTNSQPEATPSTNQPYVKLPPSKIPDMDLVTVSLVLKEKNDTIRRAVFEKLRKRKDQDKGFVNLTDDPYEPIFDISTNTQTEEISHIPYSSIAATNFYQFNTSNYIGEPLKRLIEENCNLPGVRSIKGSSGELIPNKPFPHNTLVVDESNQKSYIEKLLENIETNNFENYTSGYKEPSKQKSTISDPIFRLRKRLARNHRTFIDRRGLIPEQNEYETDDSMFSHDNKHDIAKRLESNWKFDNDLTEYQKGTLDPFSLDPSKLNSISDDTQAIRFGSMLLSKSYGLLKESVQQKQQAYLQQARIRALQNQQAKPQPSKKSHTPV